MPIYTSKNTGDQDVVGYEENIMNEKYQNSKFNWVDCGKCCFLGKGNAGSIMLFFDNSRRLLLKHRKFKSTY